MVLYRRNRVAGGCYFFTVTLHDRRQRYLTDHIDLLREAFRVVMARKPFTIDAIVVLPEHLHCIWTLPAGDDDCPAHWQAIKAHFVRALAKRGITAATQADGGAGIWQRRTGNTHCATTRTWQYIHYDPVKHGLVAQAEDWPYSSLRRGNK